MATSKYQMSVKGFQSLYETVTRKGAFRCHGINKNDTQCKRRIRASKKALSIICEDIIELLRQGTGDVQHLLTQASSMVMCIQNHQAQAARQFKTWMEMINSLQDQLSLEEDEIKPNLPLSPLPSLPDTSFAASAPDQHGAKATTVVADAGDQPSSPSNVSASRDLIFDDPGYLSDEEEETKITSPGLPLPAAEAGSASIPNAYLTPKKPQLAIRLDSGISVTYKSPTAVQKRQTAADEAEPTSPSAGKSSQGNRRSARHLPPQPSVTLVQGQTLEEAVTPEPTPVKSTPRIFSPFEDRVQDLIKYIKKPLDDIAKKEGYIYAFFVKDCGHYKMGYTGKRKGAKALEDSLTRRAKEQEKCGWHDPTKVLEYRVPHAHRVEHIIQQHLVAGRRKEHSMIQYANGKTCKHQTHYEWFDVPLDELHTTVRAWRDWMRLNPYVEKNRTYSLSAEWQERLDTVVNCGGSDPWLKWLSQYVPVVGFPQPVTNNLARGDLDENSSTAGKHDGEATRHALQSPVALTMRLRSSKTWPKVPPNHSQEYISYL